MAQIELEINLTATLRSALINGMSDTVLSLDHLAFPIVLRLLRKDPTIRALIAEDFGERVLALDDGGDTSWDEIMLATLETLENTPGGRGEVKR